MLPACSTRHRPHLHAVLGAGGQRVRPRRVLHAPLRRPWLASQFGAVELGLAGPMSSDRQRPSPLSSQSTRRVSRVRTTGRRCDGNSPRTRGPHAAARRAGATRRRCRGQLIIEHCCSRRRERGIVRPCCFTGRLGMAAAGPHGGAGRPHRGRSRVAQGVRVTHLTPSKHPPADQGRLRGRHGRTAGACHLS